MSNITASLDRKKKALRSPLVPSFKGFFLGQTIKGDVQLHGIQVLGIELEPPPLRKVGRVEDPVPPVRIVVPARADEKTRLRSRGRRSELFGVQEPPVNNGMKFHALIRVAELAGHLPVKVELLGGENLEEKILSRLSGNPDRRRR